MQYTHFIVETPKSSKSTCGNCSRKIFKEDIRVKIWHYEKTEFYHLSCYKPKLKQYITSRHITDYLKGSNSDKFQIWLNDWNLKFPPLDKPYHSIPVNIKNVVSVPSKYKRAWIEIFKFTNPPEILKIIALVSKEFYHLSWDEELWRYFCNTIFESYNPDTDWRSYYSKLTFQACFGCHCILSDLEFFRCPLISKPICKKCRSQHPNFRVFHKNAIFCRYGINPNVLELDYAAGFNNKKVTYQFLIEKALVKFRLKNKAAVLEMICGLKNYKGCAEMIEDIDVSNMDIKDSWHLPNYDTSIRHPMYNKIFKYIRSKEGGLRSIKMKINYITD